MKKIRSRKDLKVIDLMIAHGAAGYGVYVMLTEYLSERKTLRSRADIARIAYELHAEAEMVRSVLEDFGLFEYNDDSFENEKPAPKKERAHKPEPEPAPAEPAPAPLPRASQQPPKRGKKVKISYFRKGKPSVKVASNKYNDSKPLHNDPDKGYSLRDCWSRET